MTPKQYLNQYRRAYTVVRLAASRLEQAEHDAAGIRAIIYSDMPKSHNVERDLSDAMIKIEELANQYRDAVKENTAIMAEVSAVILAVPDETQMRLLWLRYIDGVRDEHDLASAIGYEVRWMWELHGRGLNAVGRILKERVQ